MAEGYGGWERAMLRPQDPILAWRGGGGAVTGPLGPNHGMQWVGGVVLGPQGPILAHGESRGGAKPQGLIQSTDS